MQETTLRSYKIVMLHTDRLRECKQLAFFSTLPCTPFFYPLFCPSLLAAIPFRSSSLFSPIPPRSYIRKETTDSEHCRLPRTTPSPQQTPSIALTLCVLPLHVRFAFRSVIDFSLIILTLTLSLSHSSHTSAFQM